MKSMEDIIALRDARKKRLAPLHARALEVKNVAYDEILLPIAERDRNAKSAVANTLHVGLEQIAMRIASTVPSVTYAPLRPGFDLHEQRARTAALVNQWWWEENRYKLLQMKRARFLQAYAMTPVVILPDKQYDYPCWKVRNPLTTLPPSMDAGEIHPDDCIFTYLRPLGWLRTRYPEGWAQLVRGMNRPSADTEVELVEYVDDAEQVLLGCAPHDSGSNYSMDAPHVELERIEHGIGIPLAVCPGRISLEEPQGQFDHLPSLWQMQAKLAALEYIATEKSVFPETWLSSQIQGETPEIIREADALRGITGVVKGGSRVDIVRPDPSMFGNQMTDRFERNMRVDGGIPPEFGGESGSNIRTGRRGDAVISATIDFQIQQAHMILEESMAAENRVAIAIDKKFFPQKKSFMLSGTKGLLTYTPAETFESDKNWVKYSHAGADANTLVVNGGQRISLGTMSHKSFMEIDPLIEDPEAELDRIDYERLKEAIVGGLQQMAATDPSFLEPAAEIAQQVIKDKANVIDAFLDVSMKWKEKQAAAAAQAQAPPGAEPGLSPEEQQPGLGQPTVAPATQGVQNLGAALATLRSANRGVPA